MDKNELGAYLKSRRKNHLVMTLEEISQRANLAPTYLSSVENGSSPKKPKFDTLQSIAAAYEVSFEKVRSAFTVESNELTATALVDLPPQDCSIYKGDKVAFGKFLTMIRKRATKTQSEWADDIHIEIYNLKKLEQGTYLKPSEILMDKIAASYNLKKSDVIAVYYAEQNYLDVDRKKVEKAIEKISADIDFSLHQALLKAVKEATSTDVLIYIIRTYEEIKGEKILDDEIQAPHPRLKASNN